MGEVLQILVVNQQCGTLAGATLLRCNLLSAISEDLRTSLDLSEVADVDLSFFQTVEAGRRHAAAEGGELTLSTGAGAALRDALDRSGFSTSFTAADRSFWFHED